MQSNRQWWLGWIAYVVVTVGLAAIADWQAALWLAAGLMIGTVLPRLERMLYPLIDQSAQQLDRMIGATDDATDHASTTSLFMHSILFIGIFVPLALYILTTTIHPLGIGVLLGISIETFLTMMTLIKHQAAFQQEFLPQVTREFSPSEQRQVVWLYAGWVLFLTVITVLARI